MSEELILMVKEETDILIKRTKTINPGTVKVKSQ